MFTGCDLGCDLVDSSRFKFSSLPNTTRTSEFSVFQKKKSVVSVVFLLVLTNQLSYRITDFAN